MRFDYILLRRRCSSCRSPLRRWPTTRARARRSTWSSGSRWRRRDSGARPSTAGSGRRRSTRPTRPPSTIWPSPTSTKASSTRRAQAYEKALELEPNNPMIRQNYELFKEINDRTNRRGSQLASRSRSRWSRARTSTRFRSRRPSSRSWTSRRSSACSIAGFIAGGSEDVDANLETVRLLRSQLRTKSSLRVIDADVLPLLELANEQRATQPADAARRRQRPTERLDGDRRHHAAATDGQQQPHGKRRQRRRRRPPARARTASRAERRGRAARGSRTKRT